MFCSDDVERIKSYARDGAGKHQTFDRLAKLGDTFGTRLSGTKALEDSIGECC